MSRAFRAEWLLAIADVARAELRAIGRYGFGDHVRDPIAFIIRLGKVSG